MLESLFNKLLGLQSCDFIKKRLQQRCFPVNTTKSLRTSLFIENLWWLPLNFLQKLLKITKENHFLVEIFSEIS